MSPAARPLCPSCRKEIGRLVVAGAACALLYGIGCLILDIGYGRAPEVWWGRPVGSVFIAGSYAVTSWILKCRPEPMRGERR